MLAEISGAGAGTAARNLGWRWGMWAPGLIGVVVGLAVLLFVRDSPEAVGYPPVEAIEVAKKKNTDGTDSEVGTHVELIATARFAKQSTQFSLATWLPSRAKENSVLTYNCRFCLDYSNSNTFC